MMHDTTCVPALVDLAALRSTVAEHGGDAKAIGPALRVDVSTDHSIGVDAYGHSEAMRQNMAVEQRRNRERFELMKWADATFDDFHVHPPGTGIMHTINLEQLACVVDAGEHEGEHWLFPDTLIGTDSHTPMINGIGVLAWGVGGLEAESAMLGVPLVIARPDVVGVRLTGKLRSGVTATDLALTITSLLRSIDVANRFVEYFGPGVATLTAGERCVVANMAPEYGGATGYFSIDQQTMTYLRDTGRSDDLLHRIEQYARRERLWFDPHAAPSYDHVVELDLGDVEWSLAGPSRPQDRLNLRDAPAVLSNLRDAHSGGGAMPIAIAAITSCTNTSDPRLLIMAGLLAQKARSLGLTVPGWFKTSLAPGSPAAETYLRRAGLMEDLEALGFFIVGYGCTNMHWQFGSACACAGGAPECPRRHSCRHIVGQPQLPGAHSRPHRSGVSGVAAAGRRICACRRFRS